MKRIITFLLIIMLAVTLCSCGTESAATAENECVIPSMGLSGTFREDGVFYSCANVDNDDLLCYYSKEAGKAVPICSKPDCTHRSRYSADCNALVGVVYGINRIGDKLYYFEEAFENDAINFIECDVNGGNRRVAAAVNDVGIGFIWGIKYQKDYVLLTYYQMYEMQEEYETGMSHGTELEKYRTFIAKIDIPTGKAEKIVTKEDYSATIWNALIDGNTLYYTYTYCTEPVTEGVNTRADVYRYGWYAVDLDSGTETKLTEGYNCMCPLKESFYHFDKSSMMCYSTDDNGLYVYDFETKKFTKIGTCEFTAALYTADPQYAMFLESYESTEYTRYCFETGEITKIPRKPYPLGEMFPSGVNIVGDTAWIHYTSESGELCMSYLDRESFWEGNFDNAQYAFNINKFDLAAQNSSAGTADTAEPAKAEQRTTLKWAIDECGITEEDIAALNKKLHDDGFDVDVEIVQIKGFTYPDRNFSDLVLDYESKEGSFDIVTLGGDWIDKVGANYNFIKSEYFRELDYDEELFSTIPEVLWEAAKVNGKQYTVPGCSFTNTGLTFCFNRKYIDEETIAGFDGSFEMLADIVEAVPEKDGLVPFYPGVDYLHFLISFPSAEMQNLILSDKTGKFESMYKNDTVIGYARCMNELYNKGLIWDKMDFSRLAGEVLDGKKQEFAVMLSGVMPDDEFMSQYGGFDNYAYFRLPFYLENRVGISTGIPKLSKHPQEAFALIKRLHTDKSYIREIDFLLSHSLSTGFSDADMDEYVENVILSPFADFVLTYDKTEKYSDVSEMCAHSFDKLCKAEDFDSELAKINDELEAAGIDEYVEYANKLLSEARNGSDN